MNYRIDLDADKVKSLINAKRFDVLLGKDQLLNERKHGRVFQSFQEGPITFIPTYKYDPNTDNWDSSEKARAPAWCDRVLWREDPNRTKPAIKLVEYRSHPQLKISDHKPVSAVFDSCFRAIDKEKEKEVMDDIMKMMDKEENDDLPSVECDKHEIDFGRVSFRDSVVVYLTIKNTGKKPIVYSFKNRNVDEKDFCKPWLIISPFSSRILVGESFKIAFELNFDIEPMLLTRLNYGTQRILDTLVLSFAGGKDLFITVSADYVPTCFGCSIDTLVVLPIAEHTTKDVMACADLYMKKRLGKIASLQNQVDVFAPNGPLYRNDRYFPIPRQLFFMIDYIYKTGSFRHDLFSCDQFDQERDFVTVRNICDSFDYMAIKKVPYSSVMEGILTFLKYLPIPVIPFQFYNLAITCRDYGQYREKVRQICEYLV